MNKAGGCTLERILLRFLTYYIENLTVAIET